MSAQIASMIAQAISTGFTAKTILQFITRKFPQYAGPIANASAAGYAADKILKQLVKPGSKNPDDDEYLTESEKTDKMDATRKKKAAIGLGVAALGATGLAAGGLAGGFARAASTIAPQVLPAQAQLPAPAPTVPQSPVQAPMATAPQGMNAQAQIPNAPQQQQPQQQSVMPTPEIEEAANASNLIEQPQQAPQPSPLEQQIAERQVQDEAEFNNLEERKPRGAPPRSEFINTARVLKKAGVFKDDKDFSNFKKWWHATEDKPRGSPTIEYEKYRVQTKDMPDFQDFIAGKEQKSQEQTKMPQEVEKIVQLPNGDFGEKLGDHKGVSTVDDNGKKVQFKDIDLGNPVEVRNAMWGLLQIPEADRSGPMDLARYNANSRELIVQFPDGKTAIYLGVDPSVADDIKNAALPAKTTGRTKTGEMWTAGEKSHGGTLSRLILRDPKYNKENQGKTWYYLEDVYDKFKKLRVVPKERKPK